jgi:hypothetical protein
LQVRVREFYIAMQRCPYIHEMKERLLGAPVEGVESRDVSDARDKPRDYRDTSRELRELRDHDNQVGTIVKVSLAIIFSSALRFIPFLLCLYLGL